MNQNVFNMNIQNIVRRKQTDVNGITLQTHAAVKHYKF